MKVHFKFVLPHLGSEIGSFETSLLTENPVSGKYLSIHLGVETREGRMSLSISLLRNKHKQKVVSQL